MTKKLAHSKKRIIWKENEHGYAGYLRKTQFATIFYTDNNGEILVIVWKNYPNGIKRTRCHCNGIFVEDIKNIALKIYNSL